MTVSTHSPTPDQLPPQSEAEAGGVVGIDIATGEACDPRTSGIFDNHIVKRQIMQRWVPGQGVGVGCPCMEGRINFYTECAPMHTVKMLRM